MKCVQVVCSSCATATTHHHPNSRSTLSGHYCPSESMREAQLPIHSSSSASTTSPLQSSMPSQLDPGRLLEDTRADRSRASSSQNGISSGRAQRNTTTSSLGGSGSSSLLKQALANRMNPEVAARRGSKEHRSSQTSSQPPQPLAKTNAIESALPKSPSTTTTNATDDQSIGGFTASSTESVRLRSEEMKIGSEESGDQMNRSILINPAWYRDDDGRTGFKPKEWDGVKGKQRSQVKELPTTSAANAEARDAVEKAQLDELLSSVAVEQQKRKADGNAKSPARSSSPKKQPQSLTPQKSVTSPVKGGSRSPNAKPSKIPTSPVKKLNAASDQRRLAAQRLSEKTGEPNVYDENDSTELYERSDSAHDGNYDFLPSASVDRQNPLGTLQEPHGENGEPFPARLIGSSEPDKNANTSVDSQAGTAKPTALSSENGLRSETSTSDSSPAWQTPSPDNRSVRMIPPNNLTKLRSGYNSLQADLSDRRDSSLSESSRLSTLSHKSVTFSDRVQIAEIEGRGVRSDSEDREDRSCLASDDETSDDEDAATAAFSRRRVSPKRQLRAKQQMRGFFEGSIRAQQQQQQQQMDSNESERHERNAMAMRRMDDFMQRNSDSSENDGVTADQAYRHLHLTASGDDMAQQVMERHSPYSEPIFGSPSSVPSSSASDTSPVDEHVLESYRFRSRPSGSIAYDLQLHPKHHEYRNIGGVYNVSQASVYEEDLYGPDHLQYLSEEDYEALQNLPLNVRRSIIEEQRHRYHSENEQQLNYQFPPAYGSMTRLHGVDSSPSSTVDSFPLMPRSASGYFEETNADSESARRLQQSLPDHGAQSPAESYDNAQQQLESSFYENVTSSKSEFYDERDRSPTPLASSFNVAEGDMKRSTPSNAVDSSDESTVVEEPPSVRQASKDLQRRQMLQSTSVSKYTTTSRTIPTVQISPSANKTKESIDQRGGIQRTRDQSEGYAQANSSRRLNGEQQDKLSKEERLRAQFLSKFGGTKAPVERMESDGEEYPTDPNHRRFSYDSMASSNSRESVVSAASIRAEATLRRNFNY